MGRIPPARRLEQDNSEFEANLDYVLRLLKSEKRPGRKRENEEGGRESQGERRNPALDQTNVWTRRALASKVLLYLSLFPCPLRPKGTYDKQMVVLRKRQQLPQKPTPGASKLWLQGVGSLCKSSFFQYLLCLRI